jgi:formylglycine-generating enzyme required for sulfatase activity/dienelactone hydrolase
MLGEQVGAYRIISQLGEGGFGVVYLAEDPRLGRRVALKFIRSDATRSNEADARLVREARAASALDHPNIATIYEIGEWQGRHFIAMAWYEGETLDAHIARGPMPIDEAVRILAQVSDGLARAHAAGIIHRDLKPANIIITRDGVAKILDFGLAAFSPSDTSTVTRLTESLVTLGTLAYMAPEQARGEHVDARADVWALGVIAYQMFAGRRPFQGAHAAAVLHAIEYDDPEPITTARADVPPELAALVMSALRRDRSARLQSAADFARGLRAWQSDSARIALQPRDSRPLLRRPAAIIAAIVIIVAGAVLAQSLVRQRRAKWVRDVALPEASRLIDNEQIVEAFDLIGQAQAALPGDPVLAELDRATSRTVPVRSEPAGAIVSYRDYLHPDQPWRVIGTTPIEAAKVPTAYLRWRFEKPGFTTVEVARLLGTTPGFVAETVVSATLVPEAETKAGMVFVPGTSEPFRLIVPGFEHLTSFEAIEPFWIDLREVTNAEFKKFVDAGGYRRREFWPNRFMDQGREIPWEQAVSRFVDSTGRPGPANWIQAEPPGGEGNLPVSGVSWYEAAAYAKFAGKELPSMAHWAHAAEPRAARWVSPFSNFGGKGPRSAETSSALHASGALDMAGNVKEWVATDVGDGRHYILGGGWDDPMYAFNDPDARDAFDRARTFGFRCAIYPTRPHSSLLASLPMSARDYRREKPAPDETFKIYAGLYKYDPQPLKPVIARTVNSAAWRQESVTITAADGTSVMHVFVYLPVQASPPFETVLFVPGANAFRTRQVDQLPHGNIEVLVKSGRAVVLPELLGTFERETSLKDSTANESSIYRDHMIAWIRDLSRTIDYMATRKDLSLDRLGYLGLSWGGRLGSILPALEPRIRSQVLVNGGFSLQKARPEVDQINFASRVTIPTLMLNGRNDFYFPYDTSQTPMFQTFATPASQKEIKQYDGGHNIPRVVLIKETLAWLDRYQPVK